MLVYSGCWVISRLYMIPNRTRLTDQLISGVEAPRTLQRLLFICSMNRWRSPTAEQIFAEHPGVECTSAGLNRGAENPLTPDLVEWADLIFVMEKNHKAKLSRDFRPYLDGKQVVCLNIPDNFQFMDPALVKLLHAKVRAFLPG